MVKSDEKEGFYYKIKMIDFGGSSLEYNKINAKTNEYWNFKLNE
jgi:hypothetical protein